MKLHRLTLKNFRQFRGTQELRFAAPSDRRHENVTVVFGENGRGKTGIFRAILFCLYGDERLLQDEEVKQKEIYLVNEPAVEEAGGKPVECFVQLEFSHGNCTYTVRRDRRGLLFEGEQIEEQGRVSLSLKREDGNTENKYDPEEINRSINEVLDRNIREYFLFDGEKIQRLTLASPGQRREIARGIKNILNIDALEKAISSTEKLKKKLNLDLEEKSSGEYQKVINEINKLEEDLSQHSRKQEQLDSELVSAENEKKLVDKNLESCKEILALLKRRKEQEENLGVLLSEQDGLLREMKTKSGRASLLLLSGTVDTVFGSINERKQKGEIPSEIRKDLIERLLGERRCICGRDLPPGTEPFRQIIAWKNRVSDVAIDSSALEIWRFLSSIRDQRDDVRTSVDTLLQAYARRNSEIEKTRKEIEELGKTIGTSERKDAVTLEKHRKTLEQKIIANRTEMSKLSDAITACNDRLDQLREKRKLLEKEQQIKDELSQRANLAEDTWKALRGVHGEFTREVKQKIMAEANVFFSRLLDKEGQETLRQIVVDDDYSLQILDRWGKRFLANISAGQRQVMSISFIAALAKVASADSILEMPLFMDTPFGRLSFEHRKNLVESVPQFCAQWVLLATDTEFTKKEAALLQQCGKWGKFYELKSEGPGVTKITERPIASVSSILRPELEENS